MAELTPLEKLQPCLLDRLTDDEPANREESRLQRVVSPQRYRAGVLRDLEWLFNAHPYPHPEGRDIFRPENYPEAYRSVINFGTRQVSGLSTLSRRRASFEKFSEDSLSRAHNSRSCVCVIGSVSRFQP